MARPMLARFLAPVALVVSALAVAGPGFAEGIDASVLAPGLNQARDAVSRLEGLTEEAEAIGNALFRVHNGFGDRRVSSPQAPGCETPWLTDLGARSRELGRAFRDAVQSVRVQASRVEALTVEPTVRPLLDPETNHKTYLNIASMPDAKIAYDIYYDWFSLHPPFVAFMKKLFGEPFKSGVPKGDEGGPAKAAGLEVVSVYDSKETAPVAKGPPLGPPPAARGGSSKGLDQRHDERDFAPTPAGDDMDFEVASGSSSH